MKIITQSETSDEAVRIFESSMEKLRRLDIAKGYLDLLQEVEGLRYMIRLYRDNFQADMTAAKRL